MKARDAVREGVLRGVVRLSDRLGFDLVHRDPYSPVPDLGSLPPAFWTEPGEAAGLRLDTGAMFEFLERRLAAYVPELSTAFGADGCAVAPGSFDLENGSFGPVDAEVLYAMVRHLAPRRIVELGSGHSTLISARAAQANHSEGTPTRLVACEPYPSEILRRGVPGLDELREVRAEEIPLGVFEDLAADDVLFIDTTHTVKMGGEVTRLVLDVLPRLAAGVVVHFHDIFLPWNYPRQLVEPNAYYWSEQYLLQAFLACNERYEVMLANHLLARTEPQRLQRTIPSAARRGNWPSSFWIRARRPPP
jgi:predicted O-methyltransferase YrrM